MEKAERDLELRRNFKLQLIQNPNFFGNLSDLDLGIDFPKPQLKIVGDTTYEEMTCLGYNPDTDILTAIVELKQGAGYSGDICEGGSPEYIRFYVDYGNGWVDHGVSVFKAHDFDHDETLCYAASIELDPKQRRCCDRDPLLPRVRAILSWNTEPPAALPNWVPVWGNRLERHIQIGPRNPIFCKFIDQIDVGVVQIDPGLVAQIKDTLTAVPKPKLPPVPLPQLMKTAKAEKDDLAMLRAIFPTVAKLASDKTDIAAFQSLSKFGQLDIDLSKFTDFILKPNFNTTYEELHCVGLDRDAETLHGIVQIKRPSGYSGDLCTDGSREYIAFYLDFGSGWEYQGTTSVEVHDVSPVPKGGLWYQAALKVDLDPHKLEWCKAGFAKIRGVLSWNTPPAPNQPNFVPHWGDREDCEIEIRPLDQGIVPGQLLPSIQSIGSMAVNDINGFGLANGPSVVAGFTANDSPFGGKINIAGMVHFPGASALEYRVMIQGPDDAVPKAQTKTFDTVVETAMGGSVSLTTVSQVPNGDWYSYLPNISGGTSVSVIGDLLYPFTATSDGDHDVYIEIRDAGTLAVLATSTTHRFVVNNKRPVVDVEITSGTGNCGKFGIGEVIAGTYAATSNYMDYVTLSITPTAEAGGGTMAITGVVPPGPGLVLPVLTNPIVESSPTSSAVTLRFDADDILTTGVSSGSWELDTTGMQPCGYNIRIYAEDRTIVNSGAIGFGASDIEGFCSEEA